MLRWAGYTDVVAAASLGADVSFCLVGGRAAVRGIGEVVEPLPFEPLDVTLIIPPLAVSTPAAYRAWDALGGPRSEGPNDLEPAALLVEPQLAVWRERIREVVGVAPTLAGSGATSGAPPTAHSLEIEYVTKDAVLERSVSVTTSTQDPPPHHPPIAGGGSSGDVAPEMRLHVLSDLHQEFGEIDVPTVPCDAVVLAGDISTKLRGLHWIVLVVHW